MGRRIAVTVAATAGAVVLAVGAVALSTGILDTEPQRRDAVGDITAVDLATLAPRTASSAEVQGVVELPGPTPDAPPSTDDRSADPVPAPSPTTAAPSAVATPAVKGAPTTTTAAVDDHGGSRGGSSSGSGPGSGSSSGSGSGGHGSDDD